MRMEYLGKGKAEKQDGQREPQTVLQVWSGNGKRIGPGWRRGGLPDKEEEKPGDLEIPL